MGNGKCSNYDCKLDCARKPILSNERVIKMDYVEEQKLRVDLKQIKEEAHKALTLMEAMSRRHAEQDQKIVIMGARLERIENLLKLELENADKQSVSQGTEPKKGFIDKVLGR